MRDVIAAAMIASALAGGLRAQTPSPEPRFEVASVKPTELGGLPPSSWQVTPTRFTARAVQLDRYVRFAFQIGPATLIAPQSILRTRFDIAATGSGLDRPEALRA